jgi:hypothetical protein
MMLAERLAAGYGDDDLFVVGWRAELGQHAFELVRSHGESGVTARLVPFTVDGLIWAASMVVLDASRRGQPVPRLAAWSLGAGIAATVGANLAHGVGHGPIGPWWRWRAGCLPRKGFRRRSALRLPLRSRG